MSEATFGQILKRLREGKELTQQALADQSGLGRVEIARLETDRRAPSWETVKALCRALGVGCDEFMEPPAVGRPKAGRPRKAKGEGNG
jgi:transcriptional regulator with XRE-family HTH domain